MYDSWTEQLREEIRNVSENAETDWQGAQLSNPEENEPTSHCDAVAA